jgi:2-polyprenyl-3-methyl-5-hydroxy-6-metoxy-1,4-benzoquinol methylase
MSEYMIREMMLGTRDVFRYFQCTECKCLQIDAVPFDLAKYYPRHNYYSFSPRHFPFERRIFRASFLQRGITYKILKHFVLTEPNLDAIAKLNLPFEANILDIGSGAGRTLSILKSLGYRNVIGIDPYIEQDMKQPVKILKANLREFRTDNPFDVIMFLHSLEHIADPIQTLALARDILEDTGTIIIRTPIISYAFEHYGIFWFQLDAPRHTFIFSETAMKIIATRIGLKISDSYYDSTLDQFIWSERYKKDISMNQFQQNLILASFSRIFSKYLKNVRILNKEKQGDQAVFYLNK